MSVVLPLAVSKAIDGWLKKYPIDQKQSAVIIALLETQESNGGWLSEDLMDAVAAYLEMPKIAVYEIATFYSMFELKPVGRHKICLCTNIACQLCDVEKLYKHLQKRLGINFGQTTKDGRFTLKEVECLAACGGAPALQIGRQYYEKVTVEQLDALLEELE